MYSPRPPISSPTSTSFASVTDPTLHRHGWQSPRARTEDRQLPSRKIPSRFRAMLRYDALLPTTPVLIPPTTPRLPLPRSPRPPVSQENDLNDNRNEWGGPGIMSSKKTNLDELKWFQHRWLDKHGKNSHLKESREKMALLRRWFESLDADGSGEVGLDELEDPLVSVGLARSRDEVQKLIDQVDKDGSGEVTFTEFLRMMNPEKPKRSRHRQPLHEAKPRVQPLVPETESPSQHQPIPRVQRPVSSIPSTRRQSLAKGRTTSSSNPVVKLFEDMQSGKLGDLTIPFPVLITAYRRRMLLNAHMSDDPTARRLGSSVLQALESTRHNGLVRDSGNSDEDRPRISTKTVSAYLKSYIATDDLRGPTTPTSSQSTQLPTL